MANEKASPDTTTQRAFPPIHPIGFALWPPLALYGQNVETIPFSVVAVPILWFAAIGALVMIAWPAFQISKEMTNRPPAPNREITNPHDLPGNMANATHKPNVVLLVLDEYSRADILEEYFRFGNHDSFQQAFKQFFTIEDAQPIAGSKRQLYLMRSNVTPMPTA